MSPILDNRESYKKAWKNKRRPDSDTFCSIQEKLTQFVDGQDQIQIYECLQKRIKASSKIWIGWKHLKSFKNWVTGEIDGCNIQGENGFQNYKISEFLKHGWTVQPPKWSRPQNDPQSWNDPQIDPEMIPTFLLVNPEMILKELGNGD